MSDIEYCLINPEIENLASEIIKDDNDRLGLALIRLEDIQFVRIQGKESKKYADIRKIGYPAKLFTNKIFLISFYDIFDELPIEKKKIVIAHELMHIDMVNDKLKKHDVEDFRDIIRVYGLDWEIK